MTRYIALIFAMLFIVSCKQSSQLNRGEEKAIIDSIHIMLHNYYADIRAFGLTAEFKYLDNSPHFFWVPPGYKSEISYDSVVAILKQNAPLLKLVDNSFDTLRILPLNRELATYTARINSTITDTTGKVSKSQLIETGLLIKRKGGWKLLSGQTSIVNQ